MTGIPKLGINAAVGKYIAGGVAVVIIGLSAALWIQGNRLDRVSAQRDALKGWQDNIVATTSAAAGTMDKKGRPALLAVDQVAPQISNLGSAVASLRQSIATQNALANERAAALSRAEAAAAADRDRFARQSATSEARIARITEIARKAPSGQCKADPALLRELEGLQ